MSVEYLAVTAARDVFNKRVEALIYEQFAEYDLTECYHGFRLYDGHTCPNEQCERRALLEFRDELLERAKAS